MRSASPRLSSYQLFLLAATLLDPSRFLCNAASSSYDGSGIVAGLGNQLPSTQTCESRTANYITHTLPQQCLRTNWSAANSTTQAHATPAAAAPTATSTVSNQESVTQSGDGTVKEDAKDKAETVQEEEELETASFMSFEEWKAIQLKKQGDELAELQAKRRQERKAEDQANRDDLDGLGDDGDIAKEFEALNEKVSELTAQAANTAANAKKGAVGNEGKKEVEPVMYEEGNKQIHRSKEAGTTCKERFSFASHDAGATIKKTSHSAKNAKSILVENKDSYMLLTCGSENKFVIVELSEDILVDTVVLANFEFFSSMIRRFRVSVSNRYPVKMDKWTDVGTFEARNSRDIQPFLVEHPGMWAKYIRIEFLTHYGNEYYCPVSLLRVHGIRMMESWQEGEGEGGNDDDDDEVLDLPMSESKVEAENTTTSGSTPIATEQPTKSAPETTNEMGLSPWRPIFFYDNATNVCWTIWAEGISTEEAAQETAKLQGEPTEPISSETTASTTSTSLDAASTDSASGPTGPSANRSATTSQDNGHPPANVSLADPAQGYYQAANGTAEESRQEQAGADPKPSPADPPLPKGAEKPQAAEKPVEKQQKSQPPPATNSKASSSSPSPSSNSASTNKSRTTTSTSSHPSSPPVQESFFKSVTKRLQLLESNTSLSLQYIEDQSLFLRDALAKMERRQLARADSFLSALNATVLAELHTLRGQYDQLWQSTVIALESQRDQSEREVLALSGRLSLLADEVVFQKRMAILQSCLLLACLVLVIFSRNGLLTGVPPGMAFYAPTSSPGGASSPPLSARYAASPSNSPLRNGTPGARRSYMPRMGQMYPDKTLPLTPTFDFDTAEVGSPSAAPSIRVDSPGSGTAIYLGGVGDAGSLTPKSMLSRESSLSLDDEGLRSPPLSPDTTASQETVVGDDDSVSVKKEKQESDAIEPVGLSTPRSAVAQLNGARKPLPALPEDPV